MDENIDKLKSQLEGFDSFCRVLTEILREPSQESRKRRLCEQVQSLTGAQDIALFINIAKMDMPETRDDIPTHLLVPAFVISELKTAFQIGFLLFLPFLVIDMVVSSVLMSMGMMMLSPVIVSLPFKIMLFVLADGWNLLIGSLIRSFTP